MTTLQSIGQHPGRGVPPVGTPVPALDAPRPPAVSPVPLVPAAPGPATLFRPQLPGVGDNDTASVISARTLLASVATAAEAVGMRNFPRCAAHPNRFWGALLLRTFGVPHGIVEQKCFEWRPHAGSYGLWHLYDRLLARPEVRMAMATIGALGLRMFLGQVGLLSDANATELSQAERAFDGMRVVKEIRAKGWRGALESEAALVGVEVESFPGRKIPNLLHPLPPTSEFCSREGGAQQALPVGGASSGFAAARSKTEGFAESTTRAPVIDSRDTVYRAIAQHYRAAGYAVRVLHGAATFAFPKKPYVLPSMREVFRHQGRTILLYRLTGTGGIMHRVDDFANFPTGEPAIAWMPRGPTPVALLSPEEEEAAYTFAAQQLGLPSPEALRALRAEGGEAYEQRPVVMVKSTDGDIAYFQLVLRGDGKAEIRPMQGRFDYRGSRRPTQQAKPVGSPPSRSLCSLGTTPEARASRLVPAHDLTEALAQLHVLIRSTPVRKKDTIMGVEVEGLGKISFQNEELPYKELISPPTRPRDIHRLVPAWQTLADRWHVGTTPYTGVSQHVHMSVPLKVNGRFSLAPLLSVYRAYLEIEAALHGIMPVHTTREGFCTSAPPALRALLQDPALLRDPTDPRQILCFLAELMHRTPPKFTALNWDKYIGALLGAMLTEGVFADGEVLEVQWRGQSYRFRVAHRPAEELYRIVWERLDDPVEVELIRVPQYAWQPTGELRIFDAVHVNRKPNRHRLDVASIQYIAEFAAAFGWLHAYAPFGL